MHFTADIILIKRNAALPAHRHPAVLLPVGPDSHRLQLVQKRVAVEQDSYAFR